MFLRHGVSFAWQAWDLVSAALLVAFAWQAWDLVHCKGSDVRPGASLGLRRSVGGFCEAGVGLGALQGVGCTPWRPLVSAALPVAFAWQVWDLVHCKGSGVRHGVPWSPPLCRWLLRGRRGTWCTARGRMYALVSLGLRRLAFAWQVWDLVLSKGSDVRPGVPWSPPLCRWLLRGRRGTWCTARGRVYGLASLGLRRSAGGFCVAGVGLGALQGVGCTPWRPLVSAALPVAFAWQVRHLVLCKGSDVRPGVHWSPPLCRWLLRGRRGTWCSPRGRMYALASLCLRRSAGGFCVAGVGLGALQGVGCTPWCPLVSAALPVAFAWQAWDLVLCKGSDVRCGVPWSPPLCRWLLNDRRGTWCTARGRVYAMTSLGLRRSAAGFCVAGAPLGAQQGVGCTPWRPLVSTHDTHNMNTAHIHHHNITYQNIT